MPATAFVFNSDQLDAAGRLYVEQGPAATRALRQQEVDGALAFLHSDACRKFRPEPQYNHSDHEGGACSS